MKVALVTTRHGTQDDRIYFKQALSLAKRLDVVMIAPDDGVNLTWAPGISFHPIPRRHGFGRLWSMIEAVRAIRREKPDFCHLHDAELALIIPLIRFLTKAKIIYDTHEVFTRQVILVRLQRYAWFGRGIAWLGEMIERAVVRFAHHIITAVAPGNLAFKGIGIPVTPIYNYPRLSVFQADSPIPAFEPVSNSERLPIVCQGALNRIRGLFHMLDAVALVKQSEPRILLKLIGIIRADQQIEFEQRVMTLGIADNVEFSGWLQHDEIATVLKTSLIGLVPLLPTPADNWALPNKLLEYMACGLPVIAARLPLMSQYVTDSDGGLLYDSTSSEELAKCILALLSNPERRRQMGENGQRAVMERWNWDRMEAALFDIYASLGAQFPEKRS